MKKVFEFFALLLDDGACKEDKNFREFVCLKSKGNFYLMNEINLSNSLFGARKTYIENDKIFNSDLEICDYVKIDPQTLISLN